MAGPVGVAAFSPYLAYRNPAYIIGGFAGILSLSFLFVQPLLAAGYMPGLAGPRGRRVHGWLGMAILVCVLLHVAGLFVTSPPDTLDALLLVAPTPFSVYGVTALWGIAITAGLVAMRRRMAPGLWRWLHNGLAFVVVVATVIHAVQIEGAMGPVSKSLLCLAVLVATAASLLDLRVLRPMLKSRQRGKTEPIP
ncbi:MAG: ferric reductase [Rhodobacteraceae bacterium]|nr:ferric reductase [Paracoccaceae bacterium]MAY48229.1 ferric reductase [Paracoccaceae bacterium]